MARSDNTKGQEKKADGLANATYRIAVLIPCYNEEKPIQRVVRDFSQALPDAAMYVYDNNSTDRTAERAQESGAIVRREPLQGKGNVVRRMFSDIEADIYVLVDGDDTYDAASAKKMIDLLVRDGLDLVIGTRLESSGDQVFRPGHRFGNVMLTRFVSYLFGNRFTDILSGYRVGSRRFVKSFPALSAGFDIEAEMTIHALDLKMPVAEVPTKYRARPQGSASKLHTIRDGIKILGTILLMFKELRPLYFFSVILAVLATASLIMAIPIMIEFMRTGLVPRFPTAILATGTMLLAFLSLSSGVVLASVRAARWEAKRMLYLMIPPVDPDA